jgi:hypothetical protein
MLLFFLGLYQVQNTLATSLDSLLTLFNCFSKVIQGV